MSEQTIEVPGLPEGWKAVSYRVGRAGVEHTLDDSMRPMLCHECMTYPVLIVEKIQPSMIVLEETSVSAHENHPQTINTQIGKIVMYHSKIVREVKETNEDPKLSLNKKDMLELIEHIKLGGQLNYKIAEFIKDK